MSQANVPPSSPMSNSFKAPPIHPYGTKAEALAQAHSQSEQPPVQQPVVQTQVQPPAQPQPPVQPQAPVHHTPPPGVASPGMNQAPQVDFQMWQRMEAERNYMMQQNQAMVQQLQEAQQTIQQLQQANQEYNDLRQRAELQASINDEAFGELSSVDSSDAVRISHATINAVQKGLDPFRQELAELRELVNTRTGQQQQQIDRQRVEALTNKVLEAYPDFVQFQHTPEYQQFMSQRDGLSHMTRDQRAAQEFRAGNTDYVIDMLRQFKEGVPNTAHIMSVAPVQTPSGQASVPTQDTPPMTLSELNTAYHMRQIPHEVYLQELKKIRSAPQL